MGSPTAASSTDLASPASEVRRKLVIPGFPSLQHSGSVPTLPVGNATPKNATSNRSFRSRVCTPKASERPGDVVAAEAVEALKKLREENLRLREENIGIREVSMATQSLAKEAVNLARSSSPARNRSGPAQKLSVAKAPLLPGGAPDARGNPRLLARLSSAPSLASPANPNHVQCRTANGLSEPDSFRPIGSVGPEVQRCCASLAQSTSQPNNGAPRRI